MTVDTRDEPRRRLPLVGALSAEAVSLIGTRVSMIAIPWFVLTTTGSAVQTGLVAAAEVAPLVLVKALGGPLIDRVGPRRVVLTCDLLSAPIVAAIPLLHGLGLLSFPLLMVLVAVAGALRGPADAAKGAMVPEISRVARLPLERVTGLSGAVERGATLVGSALAGVLIASLGATTALWLDAASFVLAASLLALTTMGLGGAAPRAATTDPASYRRELHEGWEFLRHDPVLVAICAMVAVTNLIDQAWFAVWAPVWARVSGHGVEVLGALFSVFAAASIGGALAAAVLGPRLPRFATYVVAFTLCGAPRFLVMAVESPLWTVFAISVVSGAASGFLNPILGAVILERIPEPLLGRVSSLNTAICWSLMPLGGILGGVLVSAVGLSPALLVGGAAYFVATMAPTRIPAFRSMDRADATVGA